MELEAAENAERTVHVFDLFDLARQVALKVSGLRDLARMSAVCHVASQAALPIIKLRLGDTWARPYLRTTWTRELAAKDDKR